MHRYGFGPGSYGGGRGEMFVMMGAVVILILVAALILYFILRRGGVGSSHNLISEVNTNRAVEILNEKLANGEIAEEEYTKKKLLITGK
jgi:putative membrane protein